jgi:hypothetical protein
MFFLLLRDLGERERDAIGLGAGAVLDRVLLRLELGRRHALDVRGHRAALDVGLRALVGRDEGQRGPTVALRALVGLGAVTAGLDVPTDEVRAGLAERLGVEEAVLAGGAASLFDGGERDGLGGARREGEREEQESHGFLGGGVRRLQRRGNLGLGGAAALVHHALQVHSGGALDGVLADGTVGLGERDRAGDVAVLVGIPGHALHVRILVAHAGGIGVGLLGGIDLDATALTADTTALAEDHTAEAGTGAEDPDDGDHDHQLDEGEALGLAGRHDEVRVLQDPLGRGRIHCAHPDGMTTGADHRVGVFDLVVLAEPGAEAVEEVEREDTREGEDEHLLRPVEGSSEHRGLCPGERGIELT